MENYILISSEEKLPYKVDFNDSLFIDTETVGLYGKVRLIQLYQIKWPKVVVIDCKKDRENQICKEKEKLQYYTSDYKSYVKKIPTMIQTNGPSATLAFMYSKGKTYTIIYNQIGKWLKMK